MGSEPSDLSFLTAFPLPFVAQVQEENGKCSLLSGVLPFRRERLLSRGTCCCLGQGFSHEDHESGVLGHAIKGAHDQSILLCPQVWL